MTPSEVLKVKAAVRFRDGFCCTECRMTRADHYKTYGRDLDVHRLQPGSPYTIEGAVTLCRACHASKPRCPHGSSRLPNGKVRVVLNWPLDCHRALRAVASEEEIDMGEYVSRVLMTDSRYREALERIRKARKPKQEGSR